MPATSLNFAPIAISKVMQSYSLRQALIARQNLSFDEVENLLGRIAAGIINTYEADKDFDTIFDAIVAEAGLAATVNLFSHFVVPEKVLEWEAAYVAEHPESAHDTLITLEPMQSPAEERRRRAESRKSGRDVGELWNQLMDGEPEIDESVPITSAMVNQQTADRIAALSDTPESQDNK